MINLYKKFQFINSILLPRVLTQACRDKFSSSYGSFDRNWWHYKIRDFSSIILQQGGYSLYCYFDNEDEININKSILNLIKASASFWNSQAKKYGAFEEYYPWEKGYPPLAFSTLAIAKLVDLNVVKKDHVYSGIKVASLQLLKRFESKASNQQIAGLAALSIIKKFAPELVNDQTFIEISTKSLNLQSEEGWFFEYEGPDLGYLSVTLDCLWDLFDATGDEKFLRSATRSLDFIYKLTSFGNNTSIGVLNSRNTDYVTPYGIARFLTQCEKSINNKALTVLINLFSGIDKKNHFIYAIDDRYLCHYIGHSFFRTTKLLKNLAKEEFDLIRFKKDVFFDKSGYFLLTSNKREYTSLVSSKKGGSLIINFNGKKCSDFGWILQKNNNIYVSNWWADFWEIEIKSNFIKVEGFLTSHKETISSPIKHICLRILSFYLEKRLSQY